jgi:hypothetical protein
MKLLEIPSSLLKPTLLDDSGNVLNAEFQPSLQVYEFDEVLTEHLFQWTHMISGMVLHVYKYRLDEVLLNRLLIGCR